MDSPQAQTSQPRELPPLPPGARPRPINGGFRSPAPPSSILTHRRPPSIHGRPPSPGSSSRRPPPRPVRQTSDIILPPWQPDSSVSGCPICHSGFTFFNRRHHCRKCGRVVCHSCSPHRITIPKAFVVQPPPSSSPCYTSSVPPANPSEGSSSITRSNNRASWGPEDGGILRRQSSSGDEDDGLQVRMCDECLGPHNRTQGSRSVPHPHHSNFPIPRNGYMNYNQPPPSHYNSLPSRRPPHNYYPVSNRRGELPHFQPPPQPRLKETDYCPICTLALPPIRQNGSEEDREAHIQNCIRQVEHSISPGPTSTIGSAPGRMGSAPGRPGEVMRARRYTGGGRMVVWKATEKDTWASVGDDEVTPSSTPVPTPAMTPALKVGTGEDGEEREENSPGGERGDVSGEERTGDVAEETAGVIAEEEEREEAKEEAKEESKEEVKEGVKGLAGGSSGEMVKKQVNREKAECVICFEEFEVGDIIARLECLCRYHKKCIREWFDRKGNGECPVHAVHD